MEFKKYLINSNDCYQGYCEEEGCWICGTYSELHDSDEIDNDSIEWSNCLWDDEKHNFGYFMKDEIQRYEKRYNTTVLEVALCGRMGLWNGSPVGGRIIKNNDFLDMGNVDSVDATVDKDATIVVNGHHHDGTHHMSYYFLTKNSMNKIGVLTKYQNEGIGAFDYMDFEKMYETLKPIKLSKDSDYYNYNYFIEAN